MMNWILAFITIFTLCKVRLDAAPLSKETRLLNPEEMGGHYQGDMIFPEDISRGAAHRPLWQRWPNGTIPYDMTASISFNNSLLITDAMRRMENLTSVNDRSCIQFRPKTEQDDIFITIKNGSGCSAHVGYLQNFTLNRTLTLMDSPTATCMRTGIIQHELLHILGFFHEQSRPDRDDYVSIQWNNILNSTAFNFDKYSEDDIDTLMLPYDYGSVMHYGAYDFSSNTLPTIIPTKNATAFIGQRIGMSDIDTLEVQRYYGCLPTPEANGTTSIPSTSTLVTTTVGTASTTATVTITSTPVTTTVSTSSTTTTVTTTTSTRVTTTVGTSSIPVTTTMSTTSASSTTTVDTTFAPTTSTTSQVSTSTTTSISSTVFSGSTLTVFLCGIVFWKNYVLRDPMNFVSL